MSGDSVSRRSEPLRRRAQLVINNRRELWEPRRQGSQ
jgi:hypothetical protein